MSLPPLTDVPSLEALVSDPAKASMLPPEVAKTLLIGLLSVQVILFQRSLVGSGQQAAGPSDKWLTVGEVVAQFGVTERWLYRHKKQLPHSQPSRKILLFPEDRLRRWFASRKSD